MFDLLPFLSMNQFMSQKKNIKKYVSLWGNAWMEAA